MVPNIALIQAEILDGLRGEQERLNACRLNQDFLDRRNHEHLQRRSDETSMDFQRRPKRALALTASAIEVLTAHLYNPGPVRTWPEPAGSAFLEKVYAQNQINLLMQAADAASCLNGAAAIGVYATGDRHRPIRLDLYGADELAVWTPPDDPAVPVAVCALSWDRAQRIWSFSLWTEEEYREYRGKQGERPDLVRAEANPYHVLPFAFVHDRKVVRNFWEGGVGTYLRSINQEIDRELSDLAQQAQFAIPIGLLRNVAQGQRMLISPGYFNHLRANDFDVVPEAQYLQADFPASDRMKALDHMIDLALESAGAPRSAVRLNASTNGPRAASGAAILAEQLPLLTRSKRRQPLFAAAEDDLARTILMCAGAFYDRPELIVSAAGGPLAMHWPEPALPLPIPERDQSDEWLLAHGLMSKTQILMRRFGYTQGQAREHLAQVENESRSIDG